MTTQLDWSAYPGAGGGFQGAIEMCNNNGACRKLAGGAMCPSYRVTRDERDVTRGRANTLRLAITGQLGPDALTSDEMAETLKLCVSCKACRRECPTGVDMARMKIEVQAARAAKYGLSLHDRLVGWLPRYAPYAREVCRGCSICATRCPVLRKSSRGDCGVSRPGAVCRNGGRTSSATARTGATPWRGSRAAREVVLFADTFNRYFERENLDAALSVLVAGGYRVHVAAAARSATRPLCCGRTFLSVGQVDEARARGRAHAGGARALCRARRAGRSVWSRAACLTFRDEMPALMKRRGASSSPAMRCCSRSFWRASTKAGRLQPAARSQLRSSALLHGHCHQKAFDAMGSGRKRAQAGPELSVETIESSCCGMAGIVRL